jgi:hypothetical protein
MIRWWILIALGCACHRESPRQKQLEKALEVELDTGAEVAHERLRRPAGAQPPAAPGRAARLAGLKAGGLVGNQIGATFSRDTAALERPPSDVVAGGAEPEPAAAARAWFPESFLFAPLVTTAPDGTARYQVRVPDRLTTWRVLALAHSRAGAQAGAETSFRGTLPTYVDPVVPPFLVSGDEVSLPIQIVNTTDEAVSGSLRVEVGGMTLARAPGPVRLAGQGSVVTFAAVRAGRPGSARLRVGLAGKDAVERTFPVLPAGRPVVETRHGTLAAPRTLTVALPDDADRESATARLQVFPGALAVLRAELAAAATRSDDLASDAYALLLAGRGATLVRGLGGDPDVAALRALAIVATQRAVRAVRAPDVVAAALFTGAALAHPGNPILERMGERLADTVAARQRPDGTCAGGQGWTLQRVLVTTAECVRAVRAAGGSPAARQRATRVGLRARGAFERNLARVEDPYTAAAILATGVLDGASRDQLRERVRKAIRQNQDGTRTVPVERGVLRADGAPPSDTEATALAVLALRDDREAAPLIPDLGARLLSSYDPAQGFGDGRTNLAALTAVLALFAEPLPARVTITLTQDGRLLGERTLEGPKLREVLAVELPLSDPRGPHRYEIRAEPAVAGLGYALAIQGHVPWKAAPPAGLELAIETPRQAQVGKASEIQVRAAAPAGLPFTIRHGLPAGVQPDLASLDALTADHSVASHHQQDGAIILEVAARAAGEAFSARYRVIPTLAGKLGASASSITAGAHHQDVPTRRWLVR